MGATRAELAEDTSVHLLPRPTFETIDRGEYVFIAGLRNALQSENLDRCCRWSFGYRRSRIREHRSNFSVELTGNKRIADMHRSLLNKNCRNRTTSLVELGFQDDTRRTTRRAGLKVKDVCLE